MKIAFRGKVQEGQKRGRLLSFPTANVRLHKQIPDGIYISLTKLQGKTYKSLTFIGAAIHFGEKDYKAEIHFLNFNEDMYGKWLSVQLLEKIRENQKFTSEKELIHAMENDKKMALEYFARD